MVRLNAADSAPSLESLQPAARSTASIFKSSPGLRYQELASKEAGEPSSIIRARVNQARTLQLQRFDKSKIHANAQMGTREIKRYCAVKEDTERLLETAINKLGLSARAYSRVLKVGRTIADLAGAEDIQASHIAEAIQYRSLDRRM